MIQNSETAYVAGGCFWGLQELLRGLPGVVSTEVGYIGGDNKNPTYRNHPGHAEAVRVEYDTEVILYKDLLLYFFRTHNPTTHNRQGNDRGSSYRSAIFYTNEDQKKIAKDVIMQVNASGKWENPVVTEVNAYDFFWKAEEYHQDYLQKNPGGYTCHMEYFDEF